MRRWRVRGALAPAAAAAVTAALLALSLAGPDRGPVAWPLGVPLLVAGLAALRWRHTRPGAVLAFTVAVASAYYLAGFPPGPEVVPFVVALFAVAASGRRLLAVAAVVGACLVSGSADLVRGDPEELADLFGVAGTLAAVVAAGEAHRARRAFLEQSRQRAVEGERLRIARELHDAVSHHLAVINLQAEAALARYASRPEFALTALSTISEASREALGDIRATLGAVRAAGSVAVEPALSLADLPGLAARVRATGAEVTVTLPDPPAALPAAVERAVVRIAQEALTNAARHARPRQLRLTIGYEPGQVLLDVTNDGAATTVPRQGSGIPGMRQRAEALGGELRAEPLGDGRFAVQARLPLGGGR
ncbi:histidine kinase [Phytohabitans flavus]